MEGKGMSKKAEIFQTYVTRQTPEVQNWIVRLDGHLLANGCKVTATMKKSDGAIVDYVSKITKMRVCKLNFNVLECSITLFANHFVENQSIIPELPADMLHHVKNNRGCPGCGTPPLCGMNFGRYFAFTHDGEYYECCGGGFHFNLTDEIKLDILEKWINHELAWNGEGALVNLDIKKQMVTRNTATDPLAVLPIYEQTNKQQNLNRPTVEGTCAYFLQNPTLRKGAERLINLCRELGAEPKWISKNKFIARKLIGFRFEGVDNYNVCISLEENAYYEPQNFSSRFFTMPDEFITSYTKSEKTHCKHCKKDCDCAVISPHAEVKLCPRFNVYENPTDNEIEIITQIMRTNFSTKRRGLTM
jgi:hypothetical protein